MSTRHARSELRRRYAALLEQAFAANPEPAGGRKRYEQKAGYNLAVALRDHRDEALRFLDSFGRSLDSLGTPAIEPQPTET